MLKNTTDKRNKKRFLLVQLSVIALLFLFVLKKELVVVVKDFIQNLPIGSSFVEAVAVRGYVIFTAMSNSPSLVAFCFFVLHLFVLTTSFKLLVMLIEKPHLQEEEKVSFAKSARTKTYVANYKNCYLENLRLLF